MIDAIYKKKEQVAVKWMKEKWYWDYLNEMIAMPGSFEL